VCTSGVVSRRWSSAVTNWNAPCVVRISEAILSPVRQ
jgi:hypothetical protein